jgi:hypothetical protein
MLQMIAQHHEVMNNTIVRILGFPEQHLVKIVLAGFAIFPFSPAFRAFLRHFILSVHICNYSPAHDIHNHELILLPFSACGEGVRLLEKLTAR